MIVEGFLGKTNCFHNECRCDERLKTKTNEFTRLAYTGLVVELEHLKDIDEVVVYYESRKRELKT
jgi:hypothetical protein